MIYASTFASWKLHSPGAFLYTLIRDGEAGGVPNIGTDYPMLETAGTIKVVPSGRSGSFKMVLLQSDIAESALSIIDSRGSRNRGEAGSLQSLGTSTDARPAAAFTPTQTGRPASGQSFQSTGTP
ncbi:hypothetical protein ABZ585_43285, partial [Streptomyces vietnamensis]